MISFAVWYFGWLRNYRRAKRLLREKQFDESMDANALAMLFVTPLPMIGLVDGMIIAELAVWIWF